MYLRKRLSLFILVFFFIVFLVPLYKSFKNIIKLSVNDGSKESQIPLPRTPVEDLVTMVIRLPHYPSYNTNFLSSIWPRTLLVSNKYIPNKSTNSTVKLISLDVDLLNPDQPRDPLQAVKTPFVIMSSQLPKGNLNKTISHFVKLSKANPKEILIIPFQNQPMQCFLLTLKLKEWTIKYDKISGDLCDTVVGNHAVFIPTKLLVRIPQPWMEPFPEALYIQTAAMGIKLRLIYDGSLAAERVKNIEGQFQELTQRFMMYDMFKVKKVFWGNKVEWYGCSRNTSRCFGTVYNDTPDYLLQGRWSPPCCLRVLRQTAGHVFRVLETHKIRYWLEGGSLLGAMRTGDIIPWDYDVDVGVYQNDLLRCPWIRELHRQVDKGIKFPSVVDKHGYVWETSRQNEGAFYRIQASRTNRLHVDIFPFYSKNGIMTKDTWMSHKQDKEFAESYLKPLTKIPFIGMSVSAPNNIRDFLEFKFGAGCIENPEYPNPSLLPFPRNFEPTSVEPSNPY